MRNLYLVTGQFDKPLFITNSKQEALQLAEVVCDARYCDLGAGRYVKEVLYVNVAPELSGDYVGRLIGGVRVNPNPASTTKED